MELDHSVGEKRYVQVNEETEQLGNDVTLTPDVADNKNQALASQGSPWRWRPFATRREDAA